MQYEISIEENDGAATDKKELVVINKGSYIQIVPKGRPDHNAIVGFWTDGKVILYGGNAKAFGLEAELH